jgi:hypothetical protein|tara:strand:- start:1834 stop:2037 length:204 start_codon:yes stop_codon:yes gene_type:complete
MGTPYKMKYTNGKKADTTAFPFKASPNKQIAPPTENVDPAIQEAMKKKIDEAVSSKVDEAVGGETNI